MIVNKILGAGREVVEHVLFVGRAPVFVPFLAELAAAAQVGHDKDAAVLQPEDARGGDSGVRLMP